MSDDILQMFTSLGTSSHYCTWNENINNSIFSPAYILRTDIQELHGLGLQKNDWGQQDFLYPVSECATWKQAKILIMLLTSDFICHVKSQVSNTFYVYIATYQIEGNINVVVRKFSHVGKPWVHPSVCHECHVMEIISINNPRHFNIVAVPIFRC